MSQPDHTTDADRDPDEPTRLEWKRYVDERIAHLEERREQQLLGLLDRLGLSHEAARERADAIAAALAVDRRTALSLLAAGAIGAAGGAGGLVALTETAAADASTSDSDPDLGGPSDRWDVYGDGVDTVSAKVSDAPGVSQDVARLDEIPRAGTITRNSSISGASDDGWDTENNVTVSVSFSRGFASAPHVVVSVNRSASDNGAGLRAHPFNITASGFDCQIANYSASASSSQVVEWIAAKDI